MDIWNIFFEVEKSQAPHLSLGSHLFLVIVAGLVAYLAVKHYRDKPYQRAFQLLQGLQLILLYSWYWGNAFPLAESLPLYHCRLAMFALLLLPDKSPYKQYFALLGVFGSLAAFVYPVFDAYPFPHITILSFIFGHLALLGNSLIYLLRNFDSRRLSWQQITGITFVFDAFLILVNELTHGSYGFLREPPLIGNHGILLNFVLVSALLSLAITLVAICFKHFEEVRELTLTEL